MGRQFHPTDTLGWRMADGEQPSAVGGPADGRRQSAVGGPQAAVGRWRSAVDGSRIPQPQPHKFVSKKNL